MRCIWRVGEGEVPEEKTIYHAISRLVSKVIVIGIGSQTDIDCRVIREWGIIVRKVCGGHCCIIPAVTQLLEGGINLGTAVPNYIHIPDEIVLDFEKV
jgi:hypothetical protein